MRCGRFDLPAHRPLIMGVANATPDSFSDAGQFLSTQAVIEHAWQLIDAGADILDIGGESTRPGAQPVTEADELARILPVLRACRDAAVPISVDSMKPAVMRIALAEGASMINDVNALQLPGAMQAVADSDCLLCLMHMQGEPRSMQVDPRYDDVVSEVAQFLQQRAEVCVRFGIDPARIVLDPGFGFGKTLQHNLALLRGLGELLALGYPVLAGLSRKSMLGALTGRPAGERLAGSVAAALLAAQRGATILRVHDVAETRDVLAVWHALEQSSIACTP